MSLSKIKSNMFLRYFVSYILIFSIPFVILGVIIYQNAVVNLQNEIEDSNINKLIQVKDMMDMRMKELKNIAARISFDHRLTPYMVSSNAYNTSEAIREIGKYKDNSAIIDELYLYFRGNEVIYSSKGLNAINTITKKVYQFHDWEEKQFFKDLNGVTNATIRPVESVRMYSDDKNRFIAYLYPLSRDNGNPYGTVLFLIKESVLTDLIDNILGDNQGSVYILDENNNILASKSTGVSEPTDIHKLTHNQLNPGIANITVNKETQSLVKVKSDVSGWSFITAMPTEQFLGRVIEAKTFIFILLLILVIIGLGAAIALAINQYRPIRDLIKHVKDQWGQSPKGKNTNELVLIRNSVDTIFNLNKNLISQMDDQQPLVRNQCLIKLLKGDFRNKEEADELLVSHQIEMPGPYTCVMLVSASNGLSTDISVQDNDNQIDLMKNHFSFNKAIGYVVELIDDNAIAVIVNLEDGDEIIRERQREIANYIQFFFQEHCQVTAMIGIGNIYQNVIEINRSFIEASASVEYKLIDDKGNLIFFEDIKNFQDHSSWYPIEEQVKFIQSLKQGDKVVAQETLKKMLDRIAQTEQSILLLKCMCYDIINTLFKTITEMNMSHYFQNANELLSFSSLEELQKKLNSLILQVCVEVKHNRESTNIKLRNEVLEYIHNHFKTYDLTLERTAERFHVSSSYLSRFLKEQTGSNFSHYVMNLRIEEVKRQLRDTDLTIRDIVTNVGYIDVPNFTRKFKKVEGITPGQYRKYYI